jgi:hypothetical protein
MRQPTATPATQAAAPPARSAPPVVPALRSNGATITLQYIGLPAIVVRGQATGRSYAFSAAQPVQQVDAVDGAAMLRTRYFRAR